MFVWTGKELTQDLASYLRASGWLAFTEIDVRGTGGRVDVAAVKPHSYARKDLREYEIKISKGDFRADDGKQKWRRYLQVFHRVYFAATTGILRKNDIPVDAGLIVRNENGWHVVKAARGHNPPNLTADAVLSLLFCGYEEDLIMRRLRDRVAAEENIVLADKAKKIGWQVRERLAKGNTANMERWAVELLQLCQKLTGKPVDRNGYRELRRVLGTAISLKEHLELLDEIGYFLCSLANPKHAARQAPVLSEMISNTKDTQRRALDYGS